MITAFYAGVLGLALCYLSMRVIRLRRTFGVSVGAAGNPDLERAARVQGNFVEYSIFALVLLLLAELSGAPGAILHAFGMLFLIARVMHFVGFSTADTLLRFRVLGMILTFGVIAGLSVTNVVLTATRLLS